MANNFSPGYCIVRNGALTNSKGVTKDITPIIISVSITQSIAMNSYSGSLTVLDTVGLFEQWPIRGEESLFLEIESADLGTIVGIKAHAWKIDNIQLNSSRTGYMYDIHFISSESHSARIRKTIKSFRDVKASTIVKRLFDEYYGGTNEGINLTTDDEKQTLPHGPEFSKKYSLKNNKERFFYIESSEGKLRCIIPNMYIPQAMNFIVRRSWTPRSTSSYYRFFETLSGYYFVTDEWLIQKGVNNKDQIIKLELAAVTDKHPDAALRQIRTIEDFRMNDNINLYSDIDSGGIRNAAISIDLVRRKVERIDFNYLDKAIYTDMNDKKINNTQYNDDFEADVFTKDIAKRFIIFKDFADTGDNASVSVREDIHFTEIVSNRMAYEHHLTSIQASAKIKGRLDIEPGMIVSVDAQDLKASRDDKQNDTLNGNYLVTSTLHDIADNICTTSLGLVKYG